jgi:hypothetical protein
MHPAILWLSGSETAAMTASAPGATSVVDDGDWIQRTKQQLRRQLPQLEAIWADLLAAIDQRRAESQRLEQAGGSVIPRLRFADILAARVPAAMLATIRRTGCTIIEGVVPRQTALDWDQQALDYLTTNRYAERGNDPSLAAYFGALKSGDPEIFAVYWSKPQVAARQHPAMAQTRAFLNRLWRYSDATETMAPSQYFFDPDRAVDYADRLRRRQPGDVSLGLSPHIDGGSIERWLAPSFQHVYRQIFAGNWRAHDGFDGASRAIAAEFPAPHISNFFRTYQGWIALSAQGKGDGTLQVVPMLNEALAYFLLRPLLEDAPADLLCGARRGKAQAIEAAWHQPLIDNLVSIPHVEPGDTVWWHPDLIHGVEAEHRGTGVSSVIYIPGAPLCPKNARYAATQRARFLDGRTPPDFGQDDRESGFQKRAGLADLSELGRRQMGFEAWDPPGDDDARRRFVASCG